jgi:NagD protein
LHTPFSAYIFDLDGTVYLGEALLPTAQETILQLRALGKRTVFLSNNPTHSRHDYAQKLTRLGLPTSPKDIINSSMVMADFLKRDYAYAKHYVIGEPPLITELLNANLILADDGDADTVVVSFDRTFAYHKLQRSFDLLRGGAHFFATNADVYCPTPNGGEPDAGALIAALEACSGKKCEAVVGKPSPHMINAILNLLQLPADQCMMIGDRLETDVQMGINAGMATALTLTGATTRADLESSTIKPNFVLENLSHILAAVELR